MPPKKQTFEQALSELETIIEKLETDSVTLDDALGYFEKGIHCMRVCDGHLSRAQGTIRELLKGESGEYVERILGTTAEQWKEGGHVDE